ncbi:hypothetical protein C8A01DRAFT_45868 [Parachaetomium inaequale]|uniref:Uncharacterized protein n=1 Tax=Parachaetomium inaequale TaxID=2588326 RepID=A0AAN6PKM3_9PEZI|nr:hypothetical protein C8A01DRAFT_45868 [Parachaetomium inaequale]
MVPTQDRGRSPLRGNDVPDDDDWTVYSDAESVSSYSTVSDNYFSMQDRQDHAPVFRLKRGEQDKSVYEAWNIYYYPGKREKLDGCKVLGVKLENYEEIPSRVELRRQSAAQSELADMHLQAIEGFRAKHKRCWATRAFCGRGKTYEQDLDERCKGAPSDVKKTVTDLLFDRGKATSTRYRTRTWTVVAMREQLQGRFAATDFAEVKRHKLRVWKNPKPEEQLLYTVVIRGAETKAVPAGEEGLNTFSPTSNPWVCSDNAERRRRAREERERRDTLRQKRRTLSPAFRALSPSYRTRSRARTRSVSPPSYRSWRSRYDSPPPSIPFSRSDSPPPYRRFTRSESPVRIRVIPRYTPTNFDDAPFPPTPPESFTPPPGVSAYHRPGMGMGMGMVPPPPPPPLPAAAPYTTSPFHPRPPLFQPGIMPSYHHTNPLPPPHVFRRTPPADLLPPCPSCRPSRTPPCIHYAPGRSSQPCYRPVLWHGGVSYHPPTGGGGSFSLGQQQQQQQQQQQFGGGGSFGGGCMWSGFGAVPMQMPIPPPRPMSWGSGSSLSSPGPMPPAPNPFSPLSTPPLTSAGGSSVGGSSPVLSSREVEVDVVDVRSEMDGGRERAGSEVGSERE